MCVPHTSVMCNTCFMFLILFLLDQKHNKKVLCQRQPFIIMANTTSANTCIAFIVKGNEAFVYDDYATAVAMYSMVCRMHASLEKCTPDSFDMVTIIILCQQQALEIDPHNAQAHVLRSHANIQLGNFLEASQDATKALQLDCNARGANLRKGCVERVCVLKDACVL